MPQWLPTPPTDNLYKFMAISGVWLSTLVLIIYLLLGYANFRINEDEKVFLSAAQSKNIVAEIENRLKSIDNSAFEENRLDWIPEDISPEDERNRLIYALSRHKESISKAENIAKDDTGEKLRIAIASGFWPIVNITIFAAVFLCYFGFTRWYKYVQKPADTAAKTEQLLREENLLKMVLERENFARGEIRHQRNAVARQKSPRGKSEDQGQKRE